LIYINGPFWLCAEYCGMKPSDEPKDKPPPKLSRSEEARRIIEEYAADLREIIKKLRRHLN
jgi:signal recognition particle subunit SEC65